MPSASGSFIGKTNSQAMVSAKDAPDHELSLIEVTGPQTSSDPLWNGATVSYWAAADLVAGSGPQTGYFINRHANGDIDHGSFAGKITTAGGAVTMAGDWQNTGRTRAFPRIPGGGPYNRHLLPTPLQT